MNVDLNDPSSLETQGREEGYRDQFERKRDARSRRITRDANIRRIARQESQMVFYVLILVALAFRTGAQYGDFFALLIILGGALAAWIYDRSVKRRPEYAAEEIDELAEEAVLHERIIALDALGAEWMLVRGDYAETSGIYSAPYWKMVNDRVRDFEQKSHKERQREVAELKAQSLPVREAQILSSKVGLTFPYWMKDGF